MKVFESKKINSQKLTPFNSKDYTNVMKTDALKTALDDGKYDFVYGGSRRDEEPSRSKEKIFSFGIKNIDEIIGQELNHGKFLITNIILVNHLDFFNV